MTHPPLPSQPFRRYDRGRSTGAPRRRPPPPPAEPSQWSQRDRHPAQRTLPPGGEEWLRRDVDGLPRLGSHTGTVGGHQADAPGHLGGAGSAGAVPPRGACGCAALAPARGHGDRLRRRRRDAVHRARVRGGRDAQGADQAHGPAACGRGGGVRDRDRPCADLRPHGPPGAQGRQAPERPDRHGRPRQGHRLRHRQVAGGRRARPDRRRKGAGHHRLRLARTGAGQGGHPAVRRVLAGRGGVRDAHRGGAVQGREPGGGGHEARQGAVARRAARATRGISRAGGGGRACHREGAAQPLRHRGGHDRGPRGGAGHRGSPHR